MEKRPLLLADRFTNLLKQGTCPTEGKITKCVPIPKLGKTDLSSPTSLHSISRLSCSGKTFEKVLAARIAEAVEIKEAVFNREFGCCRNRSAIDVLMDSLTEGQEHLSHNNTYYQKVNRPTIMTNNIKGAFNCVLHTRLIEVLRRYGCASTLVDTIAESNRNRMIYLQFEGEKALPVLFEAGLPQGFPLSPILFVEYGAAISKAPQAGAELTTTYVDGDLMLQGGTTQRFATQTVQERLNSYLSRGPTLNIGYAPLNAEPMHLAASTSTRAIWDDTPIKLYDAEIKPTN